MSQANRKILIVDDAPVLRNIMKTQLQRMGFSRIHEAPDGREAMKILHATRIDLVISDWNMPVMSGFELLKRVKGTPEWSHIPFLMVTAEAEKDHIVEAIQAKVDQYIIKPFTAEMLAEKINFALHKK